MKTLKTITGRILKVSSNKAKKRTFTIKTDAATYRTFKMRKSLIVSITGNDWNNFLKVK